MKLPKKFRGDGRHVYCYACKGTITSQFDKGKNRKCYHDESHHVFYSLPYSKIHKKVVTGTPKSWPGIKDPEEFFEAHNAYHKKLKANNYGMQQQVERALPTPLLIECQKYYLDWLKNDPRITSLSERKKRSPKYIQETQKRLKSFNDVLRENGINPNAAHINIPFQWVDMFFKYLTDKGYANKTFNHYMGALNGFYELMLKKKLVEDNPFANVTKRKPGRDTRIIYDDELNNLLLKIKEIYGKGLDGRNYYDDDLEFAILLGLWTGGRGEELFELKGEAYQGDFWIIKKSKESNKEEEEWSTSEDAEYREEFVTEDCKEYLEKRGLPNPGEYFIKPGYQNRKTLQDKFSRAFTHFWSMSDNEQKKEWKHLRKTFFTRKAILMEELGQYLPSHKNQSTLIGHYINHKEIIKEKMAGERMIKIL